MPKSPSVASPDYFYFNTDRPVKFLDFDVKGARINSINADVYSSTHLCIWDSTALIEQMLVNMAFERWGLSMLAFDVGYGIAEVVYENGIPVGQVVAVQ